MLDLSSFKKFESPDFIIESVKFKCKKLNSFDGADFLKIIFGKEVLSDALNAIGDHVDMTPALIITLIAQVDIDFLKEKIFPVVFSNTICSYKTKLGVEIKPQPVEICKEEVGEMIGVFDVYEICFRFMLVNFFSSFASIKTRFSLKA